MANTRVDVYIDAKDLEETSTSPFVALALWDIYRCVRRNLFAVAAQRAHALRVEPMSVMQHIRLLYILALTTMQFPPNPPDEEERQEVASEAKRLEEADGYVAEARTLAYDIGELAVYAQLTYLHAKIQHDRQCFGAALVYYKITLQAFVAQVEGLEQERILQLDTLDALAVESFLMGRYSHADQYLTATRRLLLPDEDNQQRIANLEWTQMLLERWRKRPLEALRHGDYALTAYSTRDDPLSLARLSIVIADTYLDLALPLDGQRATPQRDWALSQATPHLARALQTANEHIDPAGYGLMLLAQSRFLQTSGFDAAALHTLTSVESTARQLKDWPLLAQTQMTRGAVVTAQGDADAARDWYRAALATLGRSEAAAYAMWALKALDQGDANDGM